MEMNWKSKAALAALLPPLVVVFVSGCNAWPKNKTSDIKITNASIRSISASGSTAIQPLIDRWGKDYEKSHPMEVNYRPTGSGSATLKTSATATAPLPPAMRRSPTANSPACPPSSRSPSQPAPSASPITFRASGPAQALWNHLADIFSSEIISWRDPSHAKTQASPFPTRPSSSFIAPTAAEPPKSSPAT